MSKYKDSYKQNILKSAPITSLTYYITDNCIQLEELIAWLTASKYFSTYVVYVVINNHKYFSTRCYLINTHEMSMFGNSFLPLHFNDQTLAYRRIA